MYKVVFDTEYIILTSDDILKFPYIQSLINYENSVEFNRDYIAKPLVVSKNIFDFLKSDKDFPDDINNYLEMANFMNYKHEYYPKEYLDMLNEEDTLIRIHKGEFDMIESLNIETIPPQIIHDIDDIFDDINIEYIFKFISNVLEEYTENVVIAGGSVLASILNNNNYLDIDLWLIDKYLDNKNAIQILEILDNMSNYTYEENSIVNGSKKVKINCNFTFLRSEDTCIHTHFITM